MGESEIEQRGQRYDIQLLRCIAVLAVVVFHLNPIYLPGGYLGVDVFFVISGYLMTGHLLRRQEAGDWRFVEFIRRRVRRLFPALYLVIICTLIFSYALTPPHTAQSTAESGFASAIAVSNFYFWRTIDYFNSAAAFSPLLHTWSLGVEEQFYLIWPWVIMLGLSTATPKRTLPAILLGLGVASLVAAEIVVKRDAELAFYMLPFRVFEFCIGGLLAVSPFAIRLSFVLRALIVLASLGIIILSFRYFGENAPIPGLLALVPLAPAAAIIAADIRLTDATRMFLRPAKYIGDISYSLYLVHWPVIVFWKAFFVRSELSVIEAIFVFGLCILFADLLYRFVENPIRFGRPAWRRVSQRILISTAGAALAIFLIAASAVQTGGWRHRLSNYHNELIAYGENPEAAKLQFDIGGCFLEDNNLGLKKFIENKCIRIFEDKTNLLLFGDSIAAQYSFALRDRLDPDLWSFSQVTSSACPPILEMGKSKPQCERVNIEVVEYAEETQVFDVVIIAGNYLDHKNARIWMGRTIARLQAAGAEVVVIGPAVRFTDHVINLLLRYSARPGVVSSELFDYVDPRIFEHDKKFREALTHLQPTYFTLAEQPIYFSPIEQLCDEDPIRCEIMMNDVPLIRDQVHLTLDGADLLAQELAARIDSLRP